MIPTFIVSLPEDAEMYRRVAAQLDPARYDVQPAIDFPGDCYPMAHAYA